MNIGILALQGDVAEHEAILLRLGVTPIQVRLPHHLDGLAGLILPGVKAPPSGNWRCGLS